MNILTFINSIITRLTKPINNENGINHQPTSSNCSKFLNGSIIKANANKKIDINIEKTNILFEKILICHIFE